MVLNLFTPRFTKELKVSVRDATSLDSARFIELWEEMISEMAERFPKVDSGVTRKNTNYHKLIFDNYVEGFVKGVVLLWEPASLSGVQGILMAGAQLSERDTLDERWERPAWIHGIYLAPAARRLGGWRALHRAGDTALRTLGFTDTLGFVPADHSESFRMNTISGGKPYAILMERPLSV